ncbi:MarR family transcriptional regulator [Halioglobus maricola]|uniref:MarR family transcriptional regulator n=1 Tax=Halioglobus maricola TaxID=2601894 RepID=A0A5P9NMC5_9GAMM|nr:MarR family transcriptional regulator [Halioglobus maricola]QFU76980.1 MarR family transcriptional regulator [Halioglobus maricola]
MSTRNPSTSKPHVLDLDRQICHSLYSAANALVRAYRPLLQQLDLTYPQYLVMLSLWQRDGVSISSLAEHTRFDAGTLTPMLKRLQDKGLIDIRVAQEDERRREISVTNNGRTLRKAAQNIPEQILCTVDMPAEDGLQLKALCETLIEKLGTDPN